MTFEESAIEDVCYLTTGEQREYVALCEILWTLKRVSRITMWTEDEDLIEWIYVRVKSLKAKNTVRRPRNGF